MSAKDYPHKNTAIKNDINKKEILNKVNWNYLFIDYNQKSLIIDSKKFKKEIRNLCSEIKNIVEKEEKHIE